MLFGQAGSDRYAPYDRWTEELVDWADPAAASAIGATQPHDGWHWLNGDRPTTGRLFGGCIEVLEGLKGTAWWPNDQPLWWRDRVLFLETSEDKPSIELVTALLRNYGVQVVFDQAAALWLGRARSYSAAEKALLERAIVDVVVGEFGAATLPIVSNLDFGHTDPAGSCRSACRSRPTRSRVGFRRLESATV